MTVQEVIRRYEKIYTVFITKNPMHPVRDKHIVLVFDECHRSQFGDMHTRIVGGTIKKKEKIVKVDRYFRNYHIFDNFLYKSTITALLPRLRLL